jgi:hypothetical protein
MGRDQPRRAERNAGAFYSPDGLGMMPVPMSTLSDEYSDQPTEPQDTDRVPAIEPPGPLGRLVERLRVSLRREPAPR